VLLIASKSFAKSRHASVPARNGKVSFGNSIFRGFYCFTHLYTRTREAGYVYRIQSPIQFFGGLHVDKMFCRRDSGGASLRKWQISTGSTSRVTTLQSLLQVFEVQVSGVVEPSTLRKSTALHHIVMM
jgi:hypothetical protein